jgi:hypothetical protein
LVPDAGAAPRRRWPVWLVPVLAGVVVLVVVAWMLPPRATTGGGSLTQPSVLPSLPVPTAEPSSSAASGSPSGSPPLEPQVLLAVGDIADCGVQADEAVAELASRLPGTIALLGDAVYDDGSPPQFSECFDPAWGPMRSRIRPAVGNHEYHVDDAGGFFGYFGAAAGEAGKGWYAYDLGAWRVVVLNSNCDEEVDCGSGSEQLSWLEGELAAFEGDCLLAYWHHPRWSSGRHGSQGFIEPFWAAVRAAGGDIVLNAHDHTYERISRDGIRQFIVGTGGKSHYPFEKEPLPWTEVRDDATFGLLWLALGQGTYQWEFVGLGDTGFIDSGVGNC